MQIRANMKLLVVRVDNESATPNSVYRVRVRYAQVRNDLGMRCRREVVISRTPPPPHPRTPAPPHDHPL